MMNFKVMLAVLLLSTAGLAYGGPRIVSNKWVRAPKPDSCFYQQLPLTSNGRAGVPVRTPVARDVRDGGVFCSIDISRLPKGNHHWLVWASSSNGKKSVKVHFYFGIPAFAPSTVQKNKFMSSRICPSTGTKSRVCPGYVVSHIVPLCAYGADLPLNMRYLPEDVAAEVEDRAELAQCSPKLTPGVVPLNNGTKLLPTERAAYAGYEALTQAAEARIYAYGCAASKGAFDIYAYTDYDGNAIIELLTVDSYLNLTVAPMGKTPGAHYTIKGGGTLAGKKVSYNGQANFSPLGGMMTLSGGISQQSAKGTDRFSVKLTKNFYHKKTAPIPYLLERGEQSLVKQGYPRADYRSWSRSVRSDIYGGMTDLWKNRMNGTPCGIAIHTEGANDASGFSQSGAMTIRPANN